MIDISFPFLEKCFKNFAKNVQNFCKMSNKIFLLCKILAKFLQILNLHTDFRPCEESDNVRFSVSQIYNNKDFVTIYDGSNDHSSPIARLSGNMGSFSITSTGNSLFVKFRSSCHSKDGFFTTIHHGILISNTYDNTQNIFNSPKTFGEFLFLNSPQFQLCFLPFVLGF